MLKKMYSSVMFALSVSTAINFSLLPVIAMESCHPGAEKENINPSITNTITVGEETKSTSNQFSSPIVINTKFDLKLFEEGNLHFEEERYSDAFKCFYRGAEIGHRESQFKIARMYEKGVGVLQNITEALKFYRLSAERGHLNAQFSLGLIYLNEINEESELGLKYLKGAANRGHVEAQYIVGALCLDEEDRYTNFKEAFKYLSLAAKADIAQNREFVAHAQERLAYMYSFGMVEGSDDKARAFVCYCAAANNGHVESQFMVGCKYLIGEGVSQDINKAFECFLEAAKNGHIKSQAQMLNCYIQFDIEQSLKDAFEELMLSPHNDTQVQYQLGRIYDNNESNENDLEKSFKYLKITADKGYVQGQVQIADMYKFGEGVKQDIEEAFKYYKLAADNGDVDSQYIVGWMYGNGEGTNQSYDEAFKYYKIAADNGNVDSQTIVGCMYEKGIGADQSYTNAFKYYKLAADNGDIDSQITVANMYEKGIGADQSDDESFRYYKLAADSGDIDSQITVASMYQKGIGADQSYDESFKYYKLAADNGNISAQFLVASGYYFAIGTEKNETETINYIDKYLSSILNLSTAQFDFFRVYCMDCIKSNIDEFSCSNLLYALGHVTKCLSGEDPIYNPYPRLSMEG